MLGFFGWLWFFVRAVRTIRRAKRSATTPTRGWLLVSITAAVAAYAVGMFTYDAFSFIQVTFLLFILVGLGSALVAERSAPVTPRPGLGAGGSRSLACGRCTRRVASVGAGRHSPAASRASAALSGNRRMLCCRRRYARAASSL